MATSLLGYAIASIYQNDYELGIRSARNHIAGVLGMTRSIGDDKFAFGSSKVAVGYIDSNPLFAFSTEPVGDDSEVDTIVVLIFLLLFQCFELVGKNTFAIV